MYRLLEPVEHIIIGYAGPEAPSYKFYNVSNMWKLFELVHMCDLISFIKNVGLYRKF